MRYIGDVHGKFNRYEKLIADCPESIQVGDMGVGFRSQNGVFQNPPYDKMCAGNHRFIRGNHDYPAMCKKMQHYIADGTSEGDRFFVGGALSIDQQYRIENVSWWRDEELSYAQLQEILEQYEKSKPDIMVTHDCPEMVARRMFNNGEKLDFPSVTRTAFEQFFEIWQPRIWIFGHWHQTKRIAIDECEFQCIGECEFLDID